MKRKIKPLLTTSAVLALACTAVAQNANQSKTHRADYSRQETAQEHRMERLNGAVKTSDLIGMDVKNQQDKELGSVEDLWVDMESGRIVLVMVSSGGFVGIGDSLTAVPPSALRHDAANEVLALNATEEQFENAPKFETDMWDDSSSSKGLAAIYRHFGEDTAFNSISEGRNPGDGRRNQMGALNEKDRTSDQRDVATRNNDTSLNESRANSTVRDLMASERSGKVQRASDILGMTVKNRQNETVGDVDNIVVDLSSGRMVAVVLSSGGFLGMGDELSAVPSSKLQLNEDGDEFQLDVTKEQLSAAPRFKPDQWPDFTQPRHAVGVYSAFRMEPYFNRDASRQADNTGRNVQDSDGESITSMDQGNSVADIQTTASIRRDIHAADGMSMNARNVKIITKNGKVTLRGPVDSAEEKRLIGEIANRIARPANVDNQLTVKLNVSSN